MKDQKSNSNSDVVSVILGIFAIICGVLSFIASAIVLKFTPLVTVILVILDLCAVVNFGVMTILMYGILTYIAGMVVFFTVSIFAAVATTK